MKYKETGFQTPDDRQHIDPGGGYTGESLCKNSLKYKHDPQILLFVYYASM